MDEAVESWRAYILAGDNLPAGYDPDVSVYEFANVVARDSGLDHHPAKSTPPGVHESYWRGDYDAMGEHGRLVGADPDFDVGDCGDVARVDDFADNLKWYDYNFGGGDSAGDLS